MIAINEVVHTALIEAGHMKRDYIPTRMPDEWILAMCSGGATSAQIAKTVRIGPAMAYTKARNDKLINNHHPKRPEVHYQFSTRHYTSFSLVAVVPVFETFWIHHLDPSEWRLKSQDQIRIC